MKVELAFDLSANGVGNWFTLDDATKGKLDNTSFKLAGDVLVDVTDTVRQVNVRRGRSRTLERFTAGVASITMSNLDRRYDPLYAAGPYYGQIVPRKQVKITMGDQPVFVGNVENWSWDYDIGGDAVATVQAVDGFATLAQAVAPAGTAVTTTPGARISAVLDAAGWPATQRSIATGVSTLANDVVSENTNALNYIQQVELSEPGAFFIAADGAATFLSRDDLENPGDSLTSFGPSGIPFVEYQAASLTEEMKNKVSVTWPSGAGVGGTVTSQDTASQAAYGLFDVSYDTLLANSTQAQSLADYLVGRYATPKYRVDSVTLALHGLGQADQNTVLALELGDVTTVNWTPNGLGSPIDQPVVIDAIEHRAAPFEHFVTLTMSETVAAFVLDDPIWGLLDQNILGY